MVTSLTKVGSNNVDDGIARGCQEENGGRTAAGAEEILKP
jgi:hypothetical protein